MALKAIYTKLDGAILTDISDVSTLLPIDLDTLATIEDLVNFAGGEWTYLSLSNGSYTEEVKVTDVSGDNLVIERGTSGSTPMIFTALGTSVTNVIGLDAVKDVIAVTPVVSDVSVTGTGAAEVSVVGSVYNVDVPEGSIAGTDGIDVTGEWPNISIAFAGGAGGCCSGCGGGGSGSGGVTGVEITSDILQGSITGVVLNLSLQTPAFTGAGGIVITGTYPNFTITGSSAFGGTVTSVAVGTGLTLTGTPTVSPTISLTNTGVVAGNYGGVIVNAQGQIVVLPIGFAPLSGVTFSQAITVVVSVGTAVCTVASAAVGVHGVIALADSASPLDPTDDVTAVTPKVLAHAIAAIPASSSQGNGTSTGESDASYVNSIGTTSLVINLAAGKKMMLFAECEMLDGAAPLTPVAFGVAIAAAIGPVFVYKGKKATQSRQTICAVITGPLSDTIALVTTAVPAGATIYSSSLIAIPI